MSTWEVPEGRDADVLAAVLGMVPVRSGGRVELLFREEVMGRAEDLRSRGEGERAQQLLSCLEFDDESVFRRTFSQMASRSLQVRTSTLYRMLESMSGTGEYRNDAMRRVIDPVIRRQLEDMTSQLDEARREMLSYSLEEWIGSREAAREAAFVPDIRLGPTEERLALRTTLGKDSVPPDIVKFSRYFFKNLFRLNNIREENEFIYPPEVIENYWEVVAPDQGTFAVELCPSAGSFVLSLFDPCRSFGLWRTDNSDYFGLVEMLALEQRRGRIKGCRVSVHGATAEDEMVLQELLGIETHLLDDHGQLPYAGLPEELSPAGLAAFREGLRQLGGIMAEVRFPINERSAEGEADFTTLGFDIALDKERRQFLLDGATVSEANLDQLVLAVGEKLLALSRRLYRDPPNFPEPDVEKLEHRVYELMGQGERDGLTEEMAREIVAKIAVLDYYESLERYSYALGERIIAYLEGTQTVTFTVPKALGALLDLALEGRCIDDVLLGGLRDGGA